MIDAHIATVPARARVHERHQGHEHDALRQCRPAQPRDAPEQLHPGGRHEPVDLPLSPWSPVDGGGQRAARQQHRLFGEVRHRHAAPSAWLRASTWHARNAARRRAPIPPISADATNFFNPNPNRFGGTFGALGTPTISNADSFGAYLADQTKINQYFELLGGVRLRQVRCRVRSCGRDNPLADRRHVELARRRNLPSLARTPASTSCVGRRSIPRRSS